MTDFTPANPVLDTIRDHDAELAKAEESVAAFAAKRNDRWYPKFHIASNGGWINDLSSTIVEDIVAIPQGPRHRNST